MVPPDGPRPGDLRPDAPRQDAEATFAALNDLLDDRLDAATARALRARLDADPTLLAGFESLQDGGQLLRRDTAALEGAPDDFAARVRAAIGREEGVASGATAPAGSARARAILRWMTVAYAAAALVVVGWTVGWFVTGSTEHPDAGHVTAHEGTPKPAARDERGRQQDAFGDAAFAGLTQDEGAPPEAAIAKEAAREALARDGERPAGRSSPYAEPAASTAGTGGWAPSVPDRSPGVGRLRAGEAESSSGTAGPTIPSPMAAPTAGHPLPLPLPPPPGALLGPAGSVDPGQRTPTDMAAPAPSGPPPPTSAPRTAADRAGDGVPRRRRIHVEVEDAEAFAARLALVLAAAPEHQDLPAAAARARLLPPEVPPQAPPEAPAEADAGRDDVPAAARRIRLVLTPPLRARLLHWLRLPAEATPSAADSVVDLLVQGTAR